MEDITAEEYIMKEKNMYKNTEVLMNEYAQLKTQSLTKEIEALKAERDETIVLGDVIQNEFINMVRNSKSAGEARRYILTYCKSKLNQ